MPMFDKCLYCGKSTETDQDTGKGKQIKLHRVHGDLWCCDECLDKYGLTSEGINFIMLDDFDSY
jgi:uncharacterized protein YlaI